MIRMAAVALAIAAALVPMLSFPAAADPSCEPDSDYCAGDELVVPGAPRDADPEAVEARRTGGGGGGAGPVCTWTDVPSTPMLGMVGAGASPSPDAVLIWEMCDGAYTGASRWSVPGDPAPAPAPPAPEQLASIVRVRLEGSLPAPAVASTPAPGVAAFVGYPSFVSVTNWTGVVTDGECDPTGVLCVTVRATPSLRFSPGEPDAPVKECAGPGVAFDPAGDPFEQAATPEACAYPYRLRTGVDGRPDAWPGVVTVVWELAWSSTSGAGGSLEPVEKSASVPRAVDEVQTVVVSAGE
jgi:hypothetical protein